MMKKLLPYYILVAAFLLPTFGCTKGLVNSNNSPTPNKKTATLKAAGTTYYLNAPSYNSALQALVNAATDNDIIILKSGSHYINVPINLPVNKNNITIRGENGAVLRKTTNSFNASAFEISGNYNTIDLVDLDGGNLPEAGIIIYGQHNTVSNSRIHNCGNAAAAAAGILIHNTGNPVCCFNTVIGCSVYYNYMVGISQHGHSDGTIRDNQIYENGAEGLTIDVLSHNNYVYNNWIHMNNTSNRGVGGIGIDYSNGNRIDNNTIDYNKFRSGITFQNNIGGCDGTTITNNRINYNAQYGIAERWTQYPNTNTSSFSTNQLIGNASGTTTIIH
jgi:parallel beta-helix repeat protein